jgi:serine/threonine protein kinase
MPRADDDGPELPTMTSAEVVEVIGLYPIVRLIGQGATARVFECKDVTSPAPDRGRHVAVKVLRPELAVDSERRRRLRAEGELLKSIASPWVARCFDVGEHDGATFLVVELLAGEDLRTRLGREGALPAKDALRFVRDAAKGLRAAWAAGVVHGDVKPANLFVDGRRLKLVDFGLALPVSSSTSRSTLAGTPAFLAPEVIAGSRPDLRSDLYSLGCTLFALLTGRPPFAHARVDDLLVAHARETPPSLSRLRPGTPPRVVALVDALLQKAPSLRPQTHDEVIALIEAALDDVVGSGADEAAATTPPRSPASPRVEQPLSAPVMDPFSSGAPDDEDLVTGVPTGVHGSLKQMNVVEIVQSLEPGRKTATVDVQSAGGERGTFACDAGRVVYARTTTQVGEEAFYELVRHRAGMFRIHYGGRPPTTNITAQTQFLVLEALRRLDEGADGLDAPTTRATTGGSSGAAANDIHSAPGARAGLSAEDLPLVSADGAPLVSAEGAPLAPAEGAAVLDGAFDARPTEQQVSPYASTIVRTAVASRPGVAVDPTLVRHASQLSPSEAQQVAAGFESDDDRIVAAPARPALPPTTASPSSTKTTTKATTATTKPATGDGSGAATAQAIAQATAQAVAAAVGAARDAVTRAVAAARPATARAGAWWTNAVDALFARLQQRAGSRAPPDTVRTMLRRPAAGVVVVVVPLTLLWLALSSSSGALSGERALARIDDGDAGDVLAALDAIPPGTRSIEQRALRGHAIAALAAPSPPPDAALEEWLAATRAKRVDDRMLAGTLARLRVDDAERALDVLSAWPNADVVPRLRALLSDADWTTRQHARMALSERGEFSDVDADALGVIDLSSAETCARRREALVMLGDRGFSAAAVIAIETARTRKDDNACLQRDLPAAARAVAKRASAPRPAAR